jgi:hypothetical protein
MVALNIKQSIFAAVACAIVLFLWMFSGIESMIIKVVVTLVVFVVSVWIISSGRDAMSI